MKVNTKKALKVAYYIAEAVGMAILLIGLYNKVKVFFPKKTEEEAKEDK